MKPWGCSKSFPAEGHWMQDGYTFSHEEAVGKVSIIRHPVFILVPFRNSIDCGYDKQASDPRCQSCPRNTTLKEKESHAT